MTNTMQYIKIIFIGALLLIIQACSTDAALSPALDKDTKRTKIKFNFKLDLDYELQLWQKIFSFDLDRSTPTASRYLILPNLGCFWNCGRKLTPAEEKERSRRFLKTIGEQIAKNKRGEGKWITKSSCSGPFCFIEPVDEFLDKSGREFGNAARGINRFAIDNRETLITIAVIAAAGWVACADGCTLIAGITVSGEAVGGAGAVFVPIVESVINEQEKSDNNEKGIPNSGSNRPTQKDFSDLDKLKEDNTDTSDVLPYMKKFFKNSQYDLRPALYSAKHEFGMPFPESYIEVATPTKEWELRQDGLGGFTVRRKLDSSKSKLRRNHGGLDFTNNVGDDLYAPMSGYIERIQNPYGNKSSLTGIRIVYEVDGGKFAAGVFYVKPTPEIQKYLDNKDKPSLREKKRFYVKAGSSKLGIAQDVTSYPKNKGVEQHVHVYWEDPQGRKMTPDGKIILEVKAKK